MSFTFEKVAELKYDELISLYLIETDELLKSIFVEKIDIPFNLLYKLNKEGQLSQETKDYIYELFDKVISTRENLADRYQHLQNTDYPNKHIFGNQIHENVLVVEPKAKAIVKKTKSIPRRYGKQNILKDIAKQGFPPTPLQLAMIDIYEVRNLHTKLADRGIKDIFLDTKNYTDEECRKIRAIVKTFKQQVNEIINKNKKK